MGAFPSDKLLESLDWISLMRYGEPTDQHAPLSTFDSDFMYWNTTRKVPANKIVMGVPFYGKLPAAQRTSTDDPEIPYLDIVNASTANKDADMELNVVDSYTKKTHARMYYNGIPTMQTKTKRVITNKAAGMIIWSLCSDKMISPFRCSMRYMGPKGPVVKNDTQ